MPDQERACRCPQEHAQHRCRTPPGARIGAARECRIRREPRECQREDGGREVGQCKLPHSGISHAHGERRERSEEHTSELQSLAYLVCRLLLEKKKNYIPVSSI